MRKRTVFKSGTDIISAVLNRESYRRQMDVHQIRKKWEGIIGARAQLHTRPDGLKHGILTVTTDNPVWSTELGFIKESLISKINRVLPGTLLERITDIRFVTGRMKEKKKEKQAQPHAVKKRVLSQAEQDSIVSAVRKVKDSELKKKLYDFKKTVMTLRTKPL
jgi:hypothetical protein